MKHQVIKLIRLRASANWTFDEGQVPNLTRSITKGINETTFITIMPKKEVKIGEVVQSSDQSKDR